LEQQLTQTECLHLEVIVSPILKVSKQTGQNILDLETD